MRRKRISSGRFKSLRRGVMLSVNIKKRSVQSPVACWTNSTGFAPSLPPSARQIRAASGTRHTAKTKTLVHLLVRSFRTRRFRLRSRMTPQGGVSSDMTPRGAGSIVFTEVHSVVEARDLVAIAVKHQRVPLEKFAQAAFFLLAPARMVHAGIHVGIETVFMRIRKIPRRGRLILDEFDFHQRLDAFESVFPRYDHAHRSAVLVG